MIGICWPLLRITYRVEEKKLRIQFSWCEVKMKGFTQVLIFVHCLVSDVAGIQTYALLLFYSTMNGI